MFEIELFSSLYCAETVRENLKAGWLFFRRTSTNLNRMNQSSRDTVRDRYEPFNRELRRLNDLR